MSAAVVVSLVLLVALGVGAFLRQSGDFEDRMVWFRLGLGAMSVAMASMAFWGKLDGGPLVAGLWLAGGLIGAALPNSRAPVLNQSLGLGVAAGPLVGAVVLAQLGASMGERVIVDDLQSGLALGVGAMLALSVGFVVRAAERVDNAGGLFSGAGLPLASAAIAVLAFRRLASLGPDSMTTWLPVTGADGEAVFWMVDIGQGIQATSGQLELGHLILAGAITCLGAALIPARKVAATAAIVGGGLFVGAAAWILSLDGVAVDLTEQSKAIAGSIGRVATLQFKNLAPQIAGKPPVTISALLAAVPLVGLLCAACAAIGAGVSRLGANDDDVDADSHFFIEAAHRLAARDAFQIGALCTWIALALWLFHVRRTTGLWGPTGAADHLLAGAAFAQTALLFALHGVGSSGQTGPRLLRALAVALGIAAIGAAVLGGLVSGLGVFEL